MRLLRRATAAVTTALALAVPSGLGLGTPSAAALSPGPVVAQLNMCGTQCPGTAAQKTDWIASTVVARAVTALSLNEVCAGQLNQLTKQLGARRYPMYARFVATMPAAKACNGTAYGNAVLTRAAPLSVRTLTFAAQQGGAQRRAVTCVRVQLTKQTQVCTTHLAPGKLQATVRDRQMAETVSFVRRYAGPSLLLGDLNDYPGSDILDRVYAPAYGGGAHGAFVEGGSTRNGVPCRCGAPTRDRSKIDYVFALGTAFGAGTSSTIDAPYSDHHLLLARPDWR